MSLARAGDRISVPTVKDSPKDISVHVRARDIRNSFIPTGHLTLPIPLSVAAITSRSRSRRFGFGLPALGNLRVDGRIDDPVGRRGRFWSGTRSIHPSASSCSKTASISRRFQAAHGLVAALDIAVGYPLRACGPGCSPQRPSAGHGRSTAPARPHRTPGRAATGSRAGSLNAPCSGLCDVAGNVAPGVLDAMPDHAEPGKDAIVLAEV